MAWRVGGMSPPVCRDCPTTGGFPPVGQPAFSCGCTQHRNLKYQSEDYGLSVPCMFGRDQFPVPWADVHTLCPCEVVAATEILAGAYVNPQRRSLVGLAIESLQISNRRHKTGVRDL